MNGGCSGTLARLPTVSGRGQGFYGHGRSNDNPSLLGSSSQPFEFAPIPCPCFSTWTPKNEPYVISPVSWCGHPNWNS